jgi:hypothetical protein
MNNPYINLPSNRYWKTGVAEQHPFSIKNLYKKKFNIGTDMRIATAGSCFAQHIGTNLKKNGYKVLDFEPKLLGMSEATAQNFGYNIYSARYGNIYLARQLLQLAQEAYGVRIPEDIVWERDGRYFDALRPSVEPFGHESPEEVIAHRRVHMKHVRTMLDTMELFIFTLGLTEGWVSRKSGTVYPTAPGVIAGTFEPELFVFKNFGFIEVFNDMLEFRKLLHEHNPKCKMLLTVSPVPLTATASDKHVLLATTYSKSVLRAVAGTLSDACPDIDYFPSYELIASSFSKGFFYSPNLRNVEPNGVDAVMRIFFSEHPKALTLKRTESTRANATAVCEEALLEAFAK